MLEEGFEVDRGPGDGKPRRRNATQIGFKSTN